MTDQELADKLVELGILEWDIDTIPGPAYLCLIHGPMVGREPEHAVTDWRVAGAVMERCVKSPSAWNRLEWKFAIHCNDGTSDLDERLADPRAIIEAGVAALEVE